MEISIALHNKGQTMDQFPELLFFNFLQVTSIMVDLKILNAFLMNKSTLRIADIC